MAKKKVFQISNALTEGLEETISAAHSHSGELRVEVIPIKKIERDPDNPRELAITFADLPNGPAKTDPLYSKKIKDWEALESMANSVRREGILNPIIVYKFGEKYRLVAGERRTLASTIAGNEDIQAKVLNKKPTPLKLSLLQWAENVEREDLSLWERIRNLEKIVISHQHEDGKEGKVTPTVLSEILGCSLPHAMNYCTILEADAELKRSIQDNTVRNLEKAALVAKIRTPSLKEKALKACIDGATLKELKIIAAQDKPTAPNTNSNLQKASAKARGRQASRVSLGVTTKTSVVKHIIETILQSDDKYNRHREKFKEVEWGDYRNVTNTFKRFLKILEEAAG